MMQVSVIEVKYFTTFDYDKFRGKILDKRFKKALS